MRKKAFNLRTLLTILSVGGIVLTSVMLLAALALLQKKNIETGLLDANSVYARKLADTTDRFLTTAQRELAYGALQINSLGNDAELINEAERLRMQSGFFNSVVIVAPSATVAAASPASLKLRGMRLTSDASRVAISTRNPFISSPYRSASGNFVVSLSQPIFSAAGTYLGYVAGTIYLKKQSILNEILNEHYLDGNARISIVTNEGKVIFDHNPLSVGEEIPIGSDLRQHLTSLQSGSSHLSLSGQRYLLGYASLKHSEWNIFIYGHAGSVVQKLTVTLHSAIWFTFAILLITASISTLIATRIARPLEFLAESTGTDDGMDTLKSLSRVNTWYTEAERLREALILHVTAMMARVTELSGEAMKDPLTGLNNRRGFSELTRKYNLTNSHSVVAVDVDHFKKINDNYGHDSGDQVLICLANLLKKQSRSGDIVSRFGGEEFIFFLPDTSVEEAYLMAERVRKAVELNVFQHGDRVTVSAGVATNDCNCEDIDTLLRQADEALYRAKNSGRNKVSLWKNKLHS